MYSFHKIMYTFHRMFTTWLDRNFLSICNLKKPPSETQLHLGDATETYEYNFESELCLPRGLTLFFSIVPTVSYSALWCFSINDSVAVDYGGLWPLVIIVSKWYEITPSVEAVMHFRLAASFIIHQISTCHQNKSNSSKVHQMQVIQHG